MDFVPILAQVLGSIIWLILLILLTALFKPSLSKGNVGELVVRPFAHWQLDTQPRRRRHNITLNTPDGANRIDYLTVSTYGIVVSETKKMVGWTSSYEKQAHWAQKVCRRTFKRQPPLRQNYKHLKALEANLCANPKRLHSVLTFVGSSTFKTEVQVSATQGIGFIHYIKSLQQQVFSDAKVDVTLNALHTGRRAPHLKHGQDFKRRNLSVSGWRRPICSDLSLICTKQSAPNARQQLLGCSAAPKYRAMQNL